VKLIYTSLIVSFTALGVGPHENVILPDCRKIMTRLGEASALPASQINYKVWGDNGKKEQPTVILIHGLSGSLDTWNRIGPELAKKYRVVAYDQRGHGKTPDIGENYSSELLAADLLSLMDHLGIQKVSLVGHSMGGRTAMKFASLNPDRVESVIIEDMHMIGRRTQLPDNIDTSRRLKQLPKTFNNREEAIQALKKFYSEEEARGIAWTSLVQTSDGKLELSYHPHVNVLYYPQGLQEDLTDAMKSVKKPILFIRADRDPVLFGKGVDNVQQNKPEATVRLVPDAGHGVHFDKPVEFLNIVNHFLEGKPVPGKP